MANKIINKFKEPKFTEFSRKDLVVDIKNGALYYKSNLGVHRITSQLTSDTFGSEDIINVYQNFVTTFHQTGQRVGDSTITGDLTITQDNIVFGNSITYGDISFNRVTPRSGTDVPIHSNIYSEFTGSIGFTGSFTASNGSTLLTGSNTLFSSSFEDNDFLIITSGSYSQSFTIAKVHSDTSMSLNTPWSGNSISSSYSGYTNTGSITLSTDPDLLVVKSSNDINRLVLDKRGNLSISGVIPDNIDTFIDYRYASAPTGSVTASFGSTLITGSGTVFQSVFGLNELIKITSGSYSQTFRIDKVHSNTSMSLDSQWLGGGSGSILSMSFTGSGTVNDFQESSSLLFFKDPDLFKVKASDGKIELNVNSRGDLDVDGKLYANLTTAVKDRVVYYDNNSNQLVHGSVSSLGDQLEDAGFGSGGGGGLTQNDTFKFTGQRSGSSSITGSLILSGSEGNSNINLNVLGDITSSQNILVEGDATILGTITAQEFHTEFVSASIIYESGSTKFGDTQDDNHDFTGSLNLSGSVNIQGSGNITASGDISASGDLFGQSLTVNHLTASIVSASVRVITNNITASGNISASGNEYIFGNTQILNGNITASGDVSASGDVITSNVFLPGGGVISFDDSLDGTDQFITGTDSNLTIDGDLKIKLRANTAIEVQDTSNNVSVEITPEGGHISASGDITASGDIYSSNVYMPSGSRIYFDIADAVDQYIGMINTHDLEIYGDQRIEIRAAQETHFVKADGTPKVTIRNLTGNISASGTLNAGLTNTSNPNLVFYNPTTGELTQNPTSSFLSGLLSSSAQIATDISGAFTSTSASIATDIATNSASIATNTTNISTLTSVTSSYALEINISGAFTSTSASIAADIAANSASIAILTEGNTDNLGNHTATQDLNMSGFNIDAAQHIIASGNISASGILNAGLTNTSNPNLVFYNPTTGELTQEASSSFLSGLLSSSAQIASDISGAIDAATGSLLSNTTFISSSQQITDLGFTSNTGTVESVTSGDANTISIGGTAVDPTVSANTSAVINGSTNLATGDQIFDFVTGQGYFVGTSAGISGAINAATSSLSASLATSITNVSADTFKSTGQRNGDSVITGSLFLSGSSGHLTASGDISASGKMFGGLTLQTQTNVVFYDTTTGELTQDSSVKLLDTTGVVSSSAQILSGSGVLSSSAQIATDISGAFTSTSASIATDITTNTNNISTLTSATGSYALEANISGAFTSTSASIATDITTNSASIAININNINTLTNATGSYALEANISGAFTSTSASIATDIAANSASIADLTSATGSFLLNTTDTLDGDLTVTGTITAQEFHTEFVSASIIFTSGSTQFGNSSDDVHTFSGSINVKDDGHITASGNISSSGGTITANNINLDGHVIAGGAVSASLQLYGNEAIIAGNISATGDISSSGNILASNVYLPEDGRISFDNESTNDQYITGTDSAITIVGDNRNNIRATTETRFQTLVGATYASIKPGGIETVGGGAISSSGALYGVLSNTNQANAVFYNTTTKELTYDTAGNIGGGLISSSAQVLSGSGVLSSSAQIASDISGAFTSTSASIATDITTNTTAINALPTAATVSGSFLLNTTDTLTGDLTVTGNVSASTAHFTGDVEIESDSELVFLGTAGGGNSGVQYLDVGSVARYGLLFPGSDVVALVNRAADGVVQIRANTGTAGGGANEITVAEFEDDKIIFNQSVGIGIDDPGSILHLDFTNTDTAFSDGTGGDWGSNGLRIENQSTAENTMATIHLRNDLSDIHIASINQGSNDSDLGFFFEGLEKLRITNDGKVGIGKDTPGEALEVIGNISASGNLFGNLTDAEGSFNNTVMYDTSTGRLYFTGSYDSGGTDNLGDHTATEDLKMGSNDIVFTGNGIISSSTYLRIKTAIAPTKTLKIGSQNDNWAHYMTDSNYGHYFQQQVVVDNGGSGDSIIASYDSDLILRRDFDDSTPTQIVLGNGTLDIDNIGTSTEDNVLYYDSLTGRVTYGATPSGGGGGGTVTSVTSNTDSQLTVANTTSTPEISIVTSAVTDGGTALATGDQIYDFVTGLNLSDFNNDSGFTSNTGDITGVTAGTGITGGGSSGGVTINLDYSGTDNFIGAAAVATGAQTPQATDNIIFEDRTGTDTVRQINFGNVPLSIFNNNLQIDGLGLESQDNGVLNIKFGGNENSVITSHDSAGNDGFTAESNLIYNGQYLAVVGGDVIAFASSDKRLKDNITPISNPIKKILQIGGYTFDWNENQNTYEGHDVGVIAQEVEKIMPQVVETRENGYKAVRYEKIVPLLIEAIKDQQKQIDELKNLIKNANK